MGRTHIASPDQNALFLPGLRFLCRLFWGPDPRHCREMARGGFGEAFASVLPTLTGAAGPAAKAFSGYLESRREADTLLRDLEIVYARLFLSGRGAAGAPLYQSCYLFEDAPLMGPPALRMRRRLAEARLSIAGAGNEPPDHLAVELEYLCYLLAADPATSSLAPGFAKDELCDWLPGFSERLGKIPDAAPYHHGAILTLAIARQIAGE